MRVDLPVADTWYLANERAREFLGIADDPDLSVQSYLGVRHALWEVTQALAHTFPHRRTIGYTPFSGPEGELVALQFAKEGFTVKALSKDEFDQPKQWLESASKQTLCLLSAYDDPATGELFQSDSHVTEMKDQRIFRILISHSYHNFFHVGKPLSYDVQIISVRPDLSFAVMGERAKFVPPIAANLDWTKISVEKSLQVKSSVEAEAFKNAIGQLQTNLPVGYTVFTSSLPRLPDRVLLQCEGVEGLSLVTRIAKILKVALPQQGEEGVLETLSMCRWQDPRQLEWLSQKGLTKDKLRGTLIVSAELITQLGAERVTNALDQARKDLLAEQQG